MRTLLGISAYYHDSTAALLVDGGIVAAAARPRGVIGDMPARPSLRPAGEPAEARAKSGTSGVRRP